MERDQRWRPQAFPYEVAGDVNISGPYSPTWTIDPGVELRLHPDVGFAIGTLFEPARLVAQGAVTQPITITAATGQPWGQIYFGDHLDLGASILQHVILENGGGADPTTGQSIKVSGRGVSPNYPTPLIDHVTVRDSNGYGIDVEATGGDPKPAQLTNVTIENSALHPVNVDVNAVGGIGDGFNASGNMTDTIRVRDNELNFDSHWRAHSIPYEVVEGFSIRSNYPNEDLVPAVWTIDPGVTILMHPGVGVGIGSLYGEAQVMAQGTADNPITFTRLNANSDPWGGFSFSAYSDIDSEFHYVNMEYGGGLVDAREAVFLKRGHSKLILENVSITQSQNGAIWNFGGDVWVKDSVLSNNRYGVDIRAGSDARVNSSDLSNNAEFALNNSSPGSVCVEATGNYWGAGGPADDSDTADACGGARTNDGSGVVSDGVLYMPWQTAADGGAFGAIAPESFWVIGNGVDSTEITVTLLDEAGEPLAGKEVTLETTIGALQQPAAPTDDEGQTTAVISSTETGFATVTAFNVSDGVPVAGTAGVNFWQGGGDFGGLVNPTGTPYASPIFEVIGKPFQQGFPVEMRMPMQNTRSTPVDVEVVYGVTGLSIGRRFTPVYTATNTLQPGETWDAQGIWVPEDTGHHCIQARLSYDDGGQYYAIQDSGSETNQINTDQNPCGNLASGPGDFAPGRPKGGSGDLKTVAEHFKKQTTNMYDAMKCIDQEVSFYASFSPDVPGQQRAYEVIVTPPDYTPPAFQADENVTQAQADALNALSQTSADLLELSRAIAVTRQRMQWAAQADSLPDLDRQYEAYLDFVAQYIQKLRQSADQHDALLAVTDGAGVPDAYYYPQDYETAFADLKQNGFDTETRTFLEESDIPAAVIDELASDIIEETEGQSFQTTSFYQVVRDTRDEARQLADRLERQYGLGGTLSVEAANAGSVLPDDQAFPFSVGHQRTQTETVELVVRTVSMPMDWSARLAQENVTLGPGETMSNTLVLVPGPTIPEGSTVKIAVEGYINDEYIGGVMFTYNAPVVSQSRGGGTIYLPTIVR
jgi:hypothetical protein